MVSEHSYVNFIVPCDPLRNLMNSFSESRGPGQMHRMSSMYLYVRQGPSWSPLPCPVLGGTFCQQIESDFL